MHPVVRAILQSGETFRGKASFDGTGDYLYPVNDGSAFSFGTGDFCIEIRFIKKATGTVTLYDGRPASTGTTHLAIPIDDSSISPYWGGAYKFGSVAFSFALNTEYKIKLLKESGVAKLFINGTQYGGNVSDSTNIVSGANRPTIGAYGYTAGLQSLNGNMLGIRVTKGRSRSAESFPDYLEVDGADVALCMNFAEPLGSTTFIDETEKTITTVGNVVIVA